MMHVLANSIDMYCGIKYTYSNFHLNMNFTYSKRISFKSYRYIGISNELILLSVIKLTLEIRIYSNACSENHENHCNETFTLYVL